LSGFYPASRLIASITNAQNAVVGFFENHDFTIGEIVSFRVSPPFGMSEMNNQQSVVIAVTPTTITTNIDSLNYTPFHLIPFQIPISDVLVDTPSIGTTRIVFSSNPFVNGNELYIQNVQGTIANAINQRIFKGSNATSTTIDIPLNSNTLVYSGGGIATLYPLSVFTYPAMAVPSSSGVIPGAIPPQTNLLDAFDNIPPP
jgi:hypothetical protein